MGLPNFPVEEFASKIYNDMNNVSWTVLCMLNCSTFAVVTYSIYIYVLITARDGVFISYFLPSKSYMYVQTYIHTYACAHTHTYSMDPSFPKLH